jgi:DNA-binding response OmpR family regulator
MNTSTRVLVVDDDANICELIRLYLEKEGFAVSMSHDGRKAVEMFKGEAPDIVILDIMLPGMDGWQVCREIRRLSSIPIIMLSAKDETFNKVLGLELGADDYVVKPFSATELVARVRAVLRRSKTAEQGIQNRFFTHDNLRIDFARAEVWKDERPIYLSATEYRLLIQFAHNVGRVLTAEELLTAVWGEQYRDDKEILWVSIARLRQKLEDDPHIPQHIVTRSGLGYLMPPFESEKV